jgi:uncharacterized protein (UPF0335 family)
MSGSIEIAGDQLRAIIERIEQVEEEIKELTDAKKEIYMEAKGNGFDVKILREVIRMRKQDPAERDEQASLLDVYLQAINGASPAGKKAA